MGWITKRRLLDEVVRLNYRVADLEERLCPCSQHDWVRTGTRWSMISCGEIESIHRYKCRVCGKEKEDIV